LTIVVNSSGTTIQGNKTQVNLALQSLKMIPDMDWLASPVTGANAGKFFTYIEIIRDSDSAVIAVSNVAPYPWVGFYPGTDSPEYVTAVTGMTFNEDTPKTIFNGLTVGITDAAADNFANITYEVTLSLSDNGTTAANTAGEWTGTGSHIKTLTGTKAVVNAAIQALSFTPTMDYSSDPYILYTQKRFISGSLNQTHVTNGSLGQVTATASPLGDYYTSVSGMSYLEDTPKTIFNGLNVGISDIAGDNYSLITYEVIVKSSISGSGEWTGTGSHIKTLTGTKAVVNAALQSLEFTPTMDYSTDFNILYSQDRYVNSVLDTTHQYSDVNIGTVDGIVSPLGDYYTSVSGMSYLEDTPKTIFNGLNIGVTDIAQDNYSLITYEVIVKSSISGSGEWTGTGSHIKTLTGTKTSINAALQALSFTPTMDYSTNFNMLYSQKRFVNSVLDTTHQYSDVNIGTVNATASADYLTFAGGSSYTEDTASQTIFNGKSIGISDVAADNYANITYTVIVTIPSAAGTFDTNSSNTYTITDTKTAVNTALQNLAFTPEPDYATNFDVTYSQARLLSGSANQTHATGVNLGAVVNIPVPEFSYGTGNGNKQYMVTDGTVPTLSGQVLSPKNLTENWGRLYSTPITITDLYEDGGGASQYKLVFTGMPAGTTLYDKYASFVNTIGWQTKATIDDLISQGVRVTGATGDFTLSFALHRKTSDGTEKQIDSGTLSYVYLNTNFVLVNNSAVSNPTFGATNNKGTQLTAGDTIYAINDPAASSSDNVNDFVLDTGVFTHFSNSYSIPTGETTAIIVNNLEIDVTYPSHWSDSLTHNSQAVRRIVKLNAMSPSAPIVTTANVNVITNFNTITTFNGMKFNQTYVHDDIGNGSSDAPRGTKEPSWADRRVETQAEIDHQLQVLSQSNYWDGTRLIVDGWSGINDDGVTNWDVANGETAMRNAKQWYDYSLAKDTGYSQTNGRWWMGWNRVINTGPQGWFYGFRGVVAVDETYFLPKQIGFGTASDAMLDSVILTSAAGGLQLSWDRYNDRMTKTMSFTGDTNVTAGSFTIGESYRIVSLGTTDFTVIGGAQLVGGIFTATGVGSGSGTATVTNSNIRHVLKSGYWSGSVTNGAAGSDNVILSSYVYVQEVKYDSANDIVYLLSMLEQPSNAKYAIISKLTWSGTAYTWANVAEIELGSTSDHWGLEAYLSDDYESVVTIQHQYTDAGRLTSSTNSRIRIYDKDQGGTNNWGLAVTQNWTMAAGVSDDYGTLKLGGNGHDVNYCAYNGVDTIITQGGHHVFQKNQGGTNNWGENTSTGITVDGSGIYKYTADYLIATTSDSSDFHSLRMFDKSFNHLSTPTKLIDSTDSEHLVGKALLIEATRSHNYVGVLILTKEQSTPIPITEGGANDGNFYFGGSTPATITAKVFSLTV